jgi:hypothetical protein
MGENVHRLITLLLGSIEGPSLLSEESNSAYDPDEKPEHCCFDILRIRDTSGEQNSRRPHPRGTKEKLLKLRNG